MPAINNPMAALRLGLAALAALSLSACDDGGGTEVGAGAVSEGEARALDEAAQMLDEKRLPQGALPDVDPPAPLQNGDANSADAADAANAVPE